MYNLILFGAPGSGKGTQSQILAQKYNFYHISTGDLLRTEIAEGTEPGKLAKKLVDAGKLVPDAIVISMVKGCIDKNKDQYSGVIFDGFPRTSEQALALDAMLKEVGTQIHKVIYIEVPVQELITRIGIRSRTSNRSDDNDIDVIQARIKEYNEKTEPVLKYYKNQKKYEKVMGTGSIEEINSRISEVIDKNRMKEQE